MIQKCRIQEGGHYRTEQKIKLIQAHMYLDANRGNLNTFFDQIDNICLLYIV